jgi:biotin transport system substrate-specific component
MATAAQPRVLIDVVIPRIGADSRANRLALDAAIIVGFALFVAVCAQFAIKIPTTTVPITGQTFGVLLTGGALGSRRGGLSMLVYMVMGMAAVPVFAPASSFLGEKTAHLLLPWSGTSGQVWDMSSGGYIVGFALAAYLVGLLAERGWDRRSSVPLAMIIGSLAIYAIGLPWLGIHIANNDGLRGYFEGVYPGASIVQMTLKGGLYPFIGGDALKLLAAALVLPGAWALVDRIKGRRPGG